MTLHELDSPSTTSSKSGPLSENNCYHESTATLREMTDPLLRAPVPPQKGEGVANNYHRAAASALAPRLSTLECDTS